MAEQDIYNKLCARMFYASAIPFNFIRCPYFRKYSQFLANSKLCGYNPPTYDRLRTTLLYQEKTHIYSKLQRIRDTWTKKEVSICSDGWTDIQRKPLINIMVASEGGAMFVASTNESGHTNDAKYVANVFMKAIEKVGSNNVVQITTDNVSNYKAVGGIIEQKYPHIFWTPCVVHSLNLALKRMCEPPENSDEYLHYGDNFDIDGDMNQLANLSINEPEESMIFGDNAENLEANDE
ncbi:hypothetical protein ACH5RR_029523 [Cinchona calisaya]|uniref:DUF659 domain-containing protein n=1 Tax=Cinchona calisaya TaxID=153742 RepID=A0ABD2YWC1_9GENT